ncbi:MAG TPA: monovalent cation/H(+) antiporter subunit G [Pirellulales bacterium]|jgi:multicomponent Na+:H+ antiporter subunit G|nr:monovalent cation/H(+) antiporter subunit G [Pirellulales bacterium]
MTATSIAVDLLLATAVVVLLFSCAGLLAMRDVYTRLHYLAPASTLGPALLAAAVLVNHSSAQACIKVALIVAALAIVNPLVTHVTARAARIRETGRLDARDLEPRSLP